MPEPVSPLRVPDADPVVWSLGVVVEDLSLLAKTMVRCDDLPAAEAALGTGCGRAVRNGDLLVCGAGPGEWLVIGPEGAGPELREALPARLAGIAALTTVIDLTHARAMVRLRGPRVRDLLARVTAFDLDDRLVPDGAVWRTWVAAVVTDIVRDDRGEQASYLLHCERSSGRFLVDSLLAAGAGLGEVVVIQATRQVAGTT